ncbi:hypothetical protein MKX01_021718 [Papaver californicum]|nr:hypothetical protein MKX01_021718 [Papaver californicum]
MLANIGLRLRDIFASSEPFGNVSAVLSGDIRQLPPVFDTPLYAQGGRDLQLTGSFSYSVFEQFEESLFRDALLRPSDSKSTLQDWQMFNTRDYTILTMEERNNFKHALRLFPTNANSYEAKGLQEVVLLSKGARVMLRKNLSTQYGLVNGSMGTVVDVVYSSEEKSPSDMPVVVMVDFDKYIGQQLYEGSNVIPVTPIITSWVSSSHTNHNKLGINFGDNMSVDPVTTYFLLSNHDSQKPRINT